ncbi:MAG: HAMP domain-containing histidine kinase [Bifidobacteriaceae bacterium]|nr:HAMP domain-containing histidine kinase [Bifidobacteriaceae bacterium]
MTKPGWGLAARLVAAFALVIAVAGVGAWVVAAVIGPGVFHRHMVAAGLGGDSAALAHAEAAFRSASAVSLGIALAGAALAALALSVLITRRVSGTIGNLSRASRQIADGQFDARVAPPRLGAEFDGLASAFNQMGAALEDSQRLRDRLLADAAHELRTPVATILAYLEALEDGVAGLTPDTVQVLRAQGERLARLAADLAAVTRAQDPLVALELSTEPAADLLRAAAGAAQPGFDAKGVLLVVECGEGLSLRVDRARFAQVLANLLENALRHTPPGGTVRLAAGPVGIDDPLGGGSALDGGSAPGGCVRVTVTDSGEGIAAEHLDYIFERFYRADQARDRGHGGSGIGLAIAKALVQAHGGEISAASDGPGEGATFRIVLPV